MSSQRNTILEYFKDTVLANITTANGYNFTLATKERGLRHFSEMNDSEFPAVFVASADEQRKGVTNKDFQSVMRVFFIGYVKASSGQCQEELDKLIEDLTKALHDGATPGAGDPSHGGRVAWTNIESVDTDEGDLQPHAMCKIEATFSYKNAFINP